MDTTTIDTATVVDLFLLLLIGIGPKIALLPYLELTAGLDAGDKRRIVRTMLTTAAVVALILVVFGELLRRQLHFSTGALAIAGGIHRGAGCGQPGQLPPRPRPDARHREGVRLPARRSGGCS